MEKRPDDTDAEMLTRAFGNVPIIRINTDELQVIQSALRG